MLISSPCWWGHWSQRNCKGYFTKTSAQTLIHSGNLLLVSRNIFSWHFLARLCRTIVFWGRPLRKLEIQAAVCWNQPLWSIFCNFIGPKEISVLLELLASTLTSLSVPPLSFWSSLPPLFLLESERKNAIPFMGQNHWILPHKPLLRGMSGYTEYFALKPRWLIFRAEASGNMAVLFFKANLNNLGLDQEHNLSL